MNSTEATLEKGFREKSVPLENPLHEVWRIKDEIAAEYAGDMDRFFADLRAKQDRRNAAGKAG